MTDAAQQIDIEDVAKKPRGKRVGTAVATRAETQTAVAEPRSETAAMLSMIERIMTDPNASMERATQAFEFYQRVQAEAARKAYYEAKAAFKANAPAVVKDKDNKQYNSRYATIGNVVNTLNEALSKYGLDASWEFDQSERIKVTCTLRHTLGHSESVSLSGPPDTSGSKNPMQQIKSTLTYLKLATFEGVTGIATKEGNVDDDGNSSGDGSDPLATIDEKQQAEIKSLLEATNTNVGKFLDFAKAETVSDILAKDFTRLKAILLKKKG